MSGSLLLHIKMIVNLAWFGMTCDYWAMGSVWPTSCTSWLAMSREFELKLLSSELNTLGNDVTGRWFTCTQLSLGFDIDTVEHSVFNFFDTGKYESFKPFILMSVGTESFGLDWLVLLLSRVEVFAVVVVVVVVVVTEVLVVISLSMCRILLNAARSSSSCLTWARLGSPYIKEFKFGLDERSLGGLDGSASSRNLSM